MNRQECEQAIQKALEGIVAIYHKYNPDGNYLNLTYIRDYAGETYGFNNEYWTADEDMTLSDGRDCKKPIKVWGEVRDDDHI